MCVLGCSAFEATYDNDHGHKLIRLTDHLDLCNERCFHGRVSELGGKDLGLVVMSKEIPGIEGFTLSHDVDNAGSKGVEVGI